MTDTVSKEVRSSIMQSVKSKNTKLEEVVSNGLWRGGIRFRKNSKSLVGKPDISIKKYKIVIFIDSCFWHGCSDHCRMPSSNKNYWVKKISRNKKKDTEVTEYYKNRNWKVLRIWEHEIKTDFDNVIAKAICFIKTSKSKVI